MILYSDCDYYHDKRDDEFAPTDECESCYRYEICKATFDRDIKFVQGGNDEKLDE